MVNGILLIDKPAGWTSHDVVAKVRSMLRTELRAQSSELRAASPKLKVGHTGTLDPMATGLLILVIGSYTKKAAEFSKLDKVYEAEITLGATSTTGDAEGEIFSYQMVDGRPTKDKVDQVLKGFVGEQEQVPPQFSAIKVGGKKAYEIARKGQKIELEPRKITIYSLESIKIDYPKVRFTTKVSSGTYIRSLAQDIGEKLGTGAYLSALRRTKVGKFDIKDAIKIEQIASSLVKTL